VPLQQHPPPRKGARRLNRRARPGHRPAGAEAGGGAARRALELRGRAHRPAPTCGPPNPLLPADLLWMRCVRPLRIRIEGPALERVRSFVRTARVNPCSGLAWTEPGHGSSRGSRSGRLRTAFRPRTRGRASRRSGLMNSSSPGRCSASLWPSVTLPSRFRFPSKLERAPRGSDRAWRVTKPGLGSIVRSGESGQATQGGAQETPRCCRGTPGRRVRLSQSTRTPLDQASRASSPGRVGAADASFRAARARGPAPLATPHAGPTPG
jgi:hypothetical protein